MDCRDAFFHFLLTKKAQELFKFHGHDGVYRFLVLVMGTAPASGECHACLQRLFDFGIRLRKEKSKRSVALLLEPE